MWGGHPLPWAQCSLELALPSSPHPQGYSKVLRALFEDAGYLRPLEEGESAQEGAVKDPVFQTLESCSEVGKGQGGQPQDGPQQCAAPLPLGLVCHRHTESW